MVLFKNKLINFAEHRIASPLRRYLLNESQMLTRNIGLKKNGKGAPRALVIYVSWAVPYYMAGDVYRCPILGNHAMYWEGAEMVHLLNDQGYVVDFIDALKPLPAIEWEKYQLVIDEGNNFMNAPDVPGQRRAFYCAGLHWSYHNQAELDRLQAFYNRNHILLSPQRFVRPNFSDLKADYIFYFADPEWMKQFHPRPKRQEITTSVTFEPDWIAATSSDRDFVWIGSAGAVHKGLDLAVEAIRDIPQSRLHIFGHIQSDLPFYGWLSDQMSRHANIIYHGIAKFDDPKFHQVIEKCVGHIYPSCSEGGPGSVAQTSHFGLIPVVTKSANARTARYGYEIDSTNAEEIIQQIKFHVSNLLQLSTHELAVKREEVQALSKKVHTRTAYSEFFSTFINDLDQ